MRTDNVNWTMVNAITKNQTTMTSFNLSNAIFYRPLKGSVSCHELTSGGARARRHWVPSAALSAQCFLVSAFNLTTRLETTWSFHRDDTTTIRRIPSFLAGNFDDVS